MEMIGSLIDWGSMAISDVHENCISFDVEDIDESVGSG